ncbi:wax ester/triacylglycerol synthase domain-containing protein [Nocardia mexicana]|nr:wax ester/triacylglycerol synthase domain-containing protein [Nocardia mexicana]
MTQSDLFTWSMEHDPILRSTIVSVLLLDGPPDRDRLIDTIDRATRVVPRFRHRLVAAPFGLAPPRWVPDPDFDLSWHIRHVAVPVPATFSAVLEFARTEAMTAFDPARPLWQFTLLDGVEDGKAALVLKVHHSLTDGIGGIQIAGEILDFDRSGTAREPAPDVTAPDNSEWADIVAWNWSVGSQLARAGITLVPRSLRSTLAPIRTLRTGFATAASLFRLAQPITRTLSPVMTGRGLGRQLAVLETSLAGLRRAAHRSGCTTNDAFLTAVLLGLQIYHDKHGTKAEHLRVAVPISLRTQGDPLGGNRITIVRFVAPADLESTADLMRALDTAVDNWRHEPAIPWSNSVAATFNRLPAGLLTAMFKHIDFIASDVPGSPVPLYIAGAGIERIYPFGPTTGTAFNVTLLSHVGTCCVGINADTAAVPDLPVLTDCIAAGFRTVIDGNGADSNAQPARTPLLRRD